GQTRRHVPDFALIDRQGLITIVNVKPASRLGDAKVAATLAWAGVALPGWLQLLGRRPAPAVPGVAAPSPDLVKAAAILVTNVHTLDRSLRGLESACRGTPHVSRQPAVQTSTHAP
ncbi:MAG: hypothetical protein KY395_08630, partial [Actinobacteria bacterium]|nr:hypothetical protein [Actinomycetota bacterium]